MPNADQHLCNQIIHSIRRCSERRYFLAPRPDTVQICAYAYCLAVTKSGMVTHAEMTMSNHRQGELTDREGKRAMFHEIYHGLVGRYVNGALGRHGHFWDNRAPTEIVLLPADDPEWDTPDDPDETPSGPPSEHDFPTEFSLYCAEKGLDPYDIVLLYTWLNPVMANLVDRARDWPGFAILPDDWGTKLEVARPATFPPCYPNTASCFPVPPERWDGVPIEEARAFYDEHLTALEDIFRDKRLAAGKRLLRRRNCPKIDPFGSPNTPAKRAVAPRFAGGKQRVIRANAAYCVWLLRYTKQRRRFKAGNRRVIFPAGTVQLRRLAGVRCRGAPLPDENPHL